MGGSSNLCADLRPGEPVVLMGPTEPRPRFAAAKPSSWSAAGSATRSCSRSARALRQAGSRVLYFAGYKQSIDRYKVEEIEAAADVVV